MSVTLNVPGAGTQNWDVPLNANWALLNSILCAGATRYAELYTDVNAAIADLPAAGGLIDARSAAVNLTLGSIDVGGKSVTIMLGPYTYTAVQITLRPNLKIIGCGTGQGIGTNPPTIIQAVGSNATAPFVLAQTPNIGVQGVFMGGFRVQATVGNTTQRCFDVIAAGGSGLWQSKFDDLYITGFMGIHLNLDGQTLVNGGGINQFCIFERVIGIRPANGAYGLQIIGWNNSLKFPSCEFDGLFNTNDGATNIWIGQGANAVVFPPYDIKFDLLTCQYAGVGVQIAGANGVSFDHFHGEQLSGVLLVGSGANFGSLNISMHDSDCVNGCGVNAGNGYIVNNTASTANASIAVNTTHSLSVPDAFFKGNKGSITGMCNLQGPEGAYVYLPPQFGSPDGFGAGSSGTAVTTTTKGAGSGPTTPQTVVRYQQIAIAGTIFWLPLMQ